MLTEQRHDIILQLLSERGSLTLQEIKQELGSSDSTIRRDLNELDAAGKLVKVYGGAVAANLDEKSVTKELSVEQKSQVNVKQKQEIARYAAGLIEQDDCVFIDAGTTTEYMLDYLKEKNATYITNGVTHARKLATAGYKVFLVGGELKGTTEAVIGSFAIKTIERFNFNKGFFGVNGISIKHGATTPDSTEAHVKETAIAQCKSPYLLADSTKFDQVSAVEFAKLEKVQVITDSIPDKYKNFSNIIQVH